MILNEPGRYPEDESQVFEAKPAIMTLECPDCDAPIEIEIPVSYTITILDDRDSTWEFETVTEDSSLQPLWDHQIYTHGPKL